MVVPERLKFNANFSEFLERQELDAARDVLALEPAQQGDNQTSADRFRRLLHASDRFILNYMSKLHHLDLTTRRPLGEHLSIQTRLMRYFRRNFIPPAGRRLDLIAWPNILLLVYLVYAFLIYVVLSAQYAYDFTKILLGQYQSGDNATRLQLERTFRAANLEEELVRWLARLRSHLKILGAPHIEWSITVENILTYALLGSFFGYILGPLLCDLFDAVHFPSVRYALDARAEVKYRAELVRRELNQLIELSRSYTEAHLSLPLERAYLQAMGQSPEGASQTPPKSLELLRARSSCLMDNDAQSWLADNPVFRRHLQTIERLRALAAQGRLRPLTHDQRIADLNALICVAFFTFMFIYIQASIVALYLVVHNYYGARGQPAEFDSWRDVNTFVASVFLLFVILTSASFYGVIYAFNVNDQILLARKLKQNLDELLAQNESFVQRLRSSLAGREEPMARFTSFSHFGPLQHILDYRRANSAGLETLTQTAQREFNASDLDDLSRMKQKMGADLLNAIVQFRLFARDFRAIKRTFSATAVYNMLAGGILTIITRLLLPYIESELTTFSFALSAVGLAPVFLSMLPLCHIHCRCLDIYRTLSALLAQLNRFEGEPRLRNSLNCDFEISLLRKELAFPDRYSKHFAANTFAGFVTYSQLLKMLFWVSLILVSLLGGKGDSLLTFLTRLTPGAL